MDSKEHLNDPRFQALYKAASSSLKEFFALLQIQTHAFPDHSETLVRKARIVLAFQVVEEQEQHIIDLKTGPLPLFSSSALSGHDDTMFDLIVSIDTKKRFLDLMLQQEDGMQAYKTGSIKLVKGSMRALLKLRSLQELATRWKEDLLPGSASVPQEQKEEVDHIKEGYLDKQSEWMKRWNSRFVSLKWNDISKPQLRIYSDRTEAKTPGVMARQFFELHSGIAFHVKDKQLFVFSLVDTRKGDVVLCTFRCSSQRALMEWQEAFRTGIQARSLAVDAARKSLFMEETTGGGGGGLLDLLLATQRVCSKHAEVLSAAKEEQRLTQEALVQLQAKAQQADDYFIYSSLVESDFSTLFASFGYKFVLVLCAFGFVSSKLIMVMYRRLSSLSFTSTCALALAVSFLTKTVMEGKGKFELFRRRMRVNAMAIQMIWRLKLASLKQLAPLHSQAMWKMEFRLQAERLYVLALELRGLWVKSAQFLGARPDVMPEEALAVLKRLHDDVPPTPFALIKPIVEEELGQIPLNKLFKTFEESALASASIGQVHLATLLDGSQVVVKVQHPNISEKIQQDLTNMQSIITWVEFIEPDFQGRQLVEEWSNEVSKELDFEQEGRNMMDVGENLKRDAEIYACIPLPISCTKRTLVMRFVPGAKVNDLDNLRRVSGVETELQRSNLALDICNAFGRQLFVDGIFQADAHPGNILVARRCELDPTAVQFLPPAPENDPDRAIPILLDFGLTKRLPQAKKLAFSRLVCAMQTVDISQLLLSFEEMGLRLKREDPLEDLSEFQFAFRNTDNASKSREESMQHILRAKEKYEAKSREERNFVDAFPTELMLFFRTVFLLRGLCTSLNVRVKYLKMMGVWAARSLLAKHPSPERPLTIPTSLSPLESRLRDKFATNGGGGGMQLVVISKGATVVDIHSGTLHLLDSRPVTNKTLFPCLSLGQGVAQFALRSTFPEDSVLVSTLWSAFPPNGEFSVKDVLTGDCSKLPFSQSAVPERFFIANMHKWQDHVDFVSALSKRPAAVQNSSSSSSVLPWELNALSFAWGWTVVGLLQQQAGSNGRQQCVFEQIVSTMSTSVGGQLFARASESELALPVSKKGNLSEQEEMARERHREEVNAKYASLCIDVEKLSGGELDMDALMTNNSNNSGETPVLGGGMDLHSLLQALDPSLKGKEYFLDPRVMNCPSARSSMSPNCNLLANATSLARLYFAIGCNQGNWESQQVVPPHVSLFYSKQFLEGEKERVAELEPLGERLGVKVFEFKTSSGKVIRGFGQVAFGGSLVLCIPDLSLSLSLLLNNLTLDREFTRSVVEEICHEYRLQLVSEI